MEALNLLHKKKQKPTTKKLTRMTILSAALVFMQFACSQPTTNSTQTNANDKDTTIVTTNNNSITDYFPFKISDDNGQFLIIAEIESEELYPMYLEFFEQHEYSGNGYCWEGHITQILEKLDPELLQHIEFDPEAGAFFAVADTKENQMKMVQLLSPIFSDLSKLKGYILKADRSRIDD
jgi:hypothetical protein